MHNIEIHEVVRQPYQDLRFQGRAGDLISQRIMLFLQCLQSGLRAAQAVQAFHSTTKTCWPGNG
jgi:hypothetical protein